MTIRAFRRPSTLRTVRSGLLRAVAALLCLAAIPAVADAIHPGIVIDRDRGAVYASDRGGMAHALSIASGASLWRSAVRAYPLGLLDGRLIALGAPEVAGEAVILALDPTDGRMLGRLDLALAPAVTAQFMPLPRKRFDAHAVATDEALEIHWQYQSQPLRGALFADEDGRPVVGSPRSRQQQGTVTLRFDGGDLTAQSEGRTEAIPFTANPVATDAWIPDAEGTQWLASDGNSLAIVRMIEDATLGVIHRFEIHAPDGTRLGSFDSPYAWLPFVTHEELVLYRVDPIMIHPPGAGRVVHGSRLIAHDLATGATRWTFDALERQYFGPQPP